MEAQLDALRSDVALVNHYQLQVFERQLEAEQSRYREGLSTNFEVLSFQQQLAEALYSKNLARANLAGSTP